MANLIIEKISDTKIWIHDGSTTLMELDTTDGVTIRSALTVGSDLISPSASEMAAINGLTATSTELNTLAGVTPGTVLAGKAIVTTTDKHIDALVISAGGLAFGAGAGTAITATAAELNILAGATVTSAELATLVSGTGVQKISATVPYASFTDGGGAVGTYSIPGAGITAGAVFIYALVTAVTGFTGDTTAVMTIGDGTDADRYNTGTFNVFATASTGLDTTDPSGLRYHGVAKSPIITITKGTDWGAGTTGSVTVEWYFLT